VAAPFLSIIIPCYNEEIRLPHTLGQVFAYTRNLPFSTEIIIAENGSTDRTLQIAREFARSSPSLRVFHESMPGKGLAVRRGIRESSGEFRFICDADLSMPIEEIKHFIPPACDHDISIGSREINGATRHDEPHYRHLTGRIFNFLIRQLVLPGLQDTQCGFKCFRGAVAENIFRLQTLTGWAFDVEILTIARRHGYQIREIPISWYYKGASKVSILRDSWRMLLDLLTIRHNLSQGRYDIPSRPDL
jgi:dolichyl-phosphate beta-glucosyltransferase